MSGMKRLYEEMEELEQQIAEFKNQVKEVRKNERDSPERRLKINRLLINLGKHSNELTALKEGL